MSHDLTVLNDGATVQNELKMGHQISNFPPVLKSERVSEHSEVVARSCG